MDNTVPRPRKSFEIRRWRDTAPEAEIAIMQVQPLSPAATDGAARLFEAGIGEGSENRLLFETDGMSLTYVWFKSGYPLPRHTHDGDCLYFVLAGSLRLGTAELGRGDSFFVGAGTPYGYTPGPDGVEVLEFRGANAFDIKLKADNLAFWAKAAEATRQRRPAWQDETRPSGL